MSAGKLDPLQGAYGLHSWAAQNHKLETSVVATRKERILRYRRDNTVRNVKTANVGDDEHQE